MASSTDVIGPITRNVEDTSLILDVIAGRDLLDGTTIEREEKYELSKTTLSGKKIGVVREYMSEGLDEGVKKVINTAILQLKDQGAEIVDVSLPSLPLALAVYYIICPAEVSSNLGRYDGQRFGHATKNAKNLEDSYAMSRAEGFGAEAKRRIMIGTYVLSSGYYEAYYKKAALVRTKLINEFNDAFNSVDFLVGPTSPITAFKVGEKIDDPLKMYLIDIMTVAANLTGSPAISVPAGVSGGLPVGLQIIAPWGKDKSLLEAATMFLGESK
jgi:aspartyl-tRNA(Asn)/glutamyl-tRNA(Gln) amidotransferase subunit A